MVCVQSSVNSVNGNTDSADSKAKESSSTSPEMPADEAWQKMQLIGMKASELYL